MLKALSLRINGIVQGVGFRPWVYRLATQHELNGWIHNASDGVTIEIEGNASHIERFVQELREFPPPLARIERFDTEATEPKGYQDFSIRESQASEGWTLASPDVATCEDCLKDIQAPSNPRHGYAFTNCTNCGPRYSIITGLPYDRPQTTMGQFAMCPRCNREYHDPLDRRFHAQPTCCPECGPALFFDEPGDPLTMAREALKRGEILALKGLGGYQLVLDGTQEPAVRRLRERKHRPDKPLALMVRSLDVARKYAVVSEEEAKLLSSPEAPIVLLKRLSMESLPGIAPGLDRLGIMLPNTPLHHLILGSETGFPEVLVVTSGNVSGEPLAIHDEDAKRRLGAIADHFLWHNREICTPVDDSVVRLDNPGLTVLRRARGYAPSPVDLPIPSEGILALGGDLKCAIALTKGGRAIFGQHIGDLEDSLSREAFVRIRDHLTTLFKINPRVVVCDLHPDYHSHQMAREMGLPLIPVQHHRAHIAACLAENGIAPDIPVIGVAWDGTGYGDDGTIWGSEFFTGPVTHLVRRAHLAPVPLPGGDAATKAPYRLALAALYAQGIPLEGTLPYEVAGNEVGILIRMLERGLNVPFSSGAGRLFDLVASLLGICHRASFEGQGAQLLEAIATPTNTSYPWSLDGSVLSIKGVLLGILNDLRQGIALDLIAGRFHRTLAEMIVGVCNSLDADSRLVALSGGVFQNRLLLEQTCLLLIERGFNPLIHRQVPANDGGLALGQAYLGTLFAE